MVEIKSTSYLILEGTVLAITDYDTLEFKLHIYEEAKKDSKYPCPDYNFNPPIIF